MAAPARLVRVAAVDQFDGVRVTDVTLAARRVVRLGCGCERFECDRPGGGDVHVLVGAHCDPDGLNSLTAVA